MDFGELQTLTSKTVRDIFATKKMCINSWPSFLFSGRKASYNHQTELNSIIIRVSRVGN